MASQSGQSKIKTQQSQYIKSHCIFDGTFRVTHLYEAPSAAVNGSPCMVTRFQFDGVSTRVSGSIEEDATWSSAWDF